MFHTCLQLCAGGGSLPNNLAGREENRNILQAPPGIELSKYGYPPVSLREFCMVVTVALNLR